jgi:hypothetical protein
MLNPNRKPTEPLNVINSGIRQLSCIVYKGREAKTDWHRVIRPASPKDVDDVELSQLNDDMCF